MIFTDICLITPNVLELVAFYETVFNATAAEKNNIHSYITVAGLNIAIYEKAAAEANGSDFTNTGTGMNTICFNVGDVDAEYERLKALNVDLVTKPRLWPWGAKSFRFNDPNGNAIVFRNWPKQS